MHVLNALQNSSYSTCVFFQKLWALPLMGVKTTMTSVQQTGMKVTHARSHHQDTFPTPGI